MYLLGDTDNLAACKYLERYLSWTKQLWASAYAQMCSF